MEPDSFTINLVTADVDIKELNTCTKMKTFWSPVNSYPLEQDNIAWVSSSDAILLPDRSFFVSRPLLLQVILFHSSVFLFKFMSFYLSILESISSSCGSEENIFFGSCSN